MTLLRRAALYFAAAAIGGLAVVLTVWAFGQIGIADRVGSLTPGKDADFFVTDGDPLDPRYPPKQVFIEGRLVYRTGDAQ